MYVLFLNSQCGRWFPAPDSKFQSNTTSSASIEKINQNRRRSKHHPSEDHLALWAHLLRRLSNQSINWSSTCFILFLVLDFYLFLLCAYRVRSLMCMNITQSLGESPWQKDVTGDISAECGGRHWSPHNQRNCRVRRGCRSSAAPFCLHLYCLVLAFVLGERDTKILYCIRGLTFSIFGNV